tara:strand:+ start:908 stop:1234 length:327 start_codon:yes stop_codon:yes gene_type:complete
MKFKKGDRVKVISTTSEDIGHNGKIGVVVECDRGLFYDLRVDLDNGYSPLFRNPSVELVSKTYTEDQCRKKIELWKARLAIAELKESTPEYTMEEVTKLIGHEFKIKK